MKPFICFTMILVLMTFTACVSSTAASAENAAAQKPYKLTSEYLQHPDKIIAKADQTAAFWLKTIDPKYGGFFTNISQDGTPDPKITYKVSFVQSRNAFGMARAYQLTGKKEYLNAARNALDFVYEHAWDNVNGGWNQEMSQDGSLAEQGLEGMPWNTMKWAFNQLNMLAGLSAMADVTRSKKDIEWLNKSFTAYTNKMWDARPGYEGYIGMGDADWSGMSGKSIGTTNDVIIAHQMSMTLMNTDKAYKERLLQTADRFVKMVATMDLREFGMEEYYDNDWKVLQAQPTTNTISGNLLKPSLCLAMAYSIEPKPEYKAASKKLIDEILNSNAYDAVNGGSYNTLNAATGEPTDKHKCWWEFEQCILSALMNYNMSGETQYLKMADKSLAAFMSKMYDSKYGDVFADLDENGKPLSTQKGNYWKESYHTIELFYYTYLYGSLMLQKKPVSLYYSIEAQDQERSLTLQPMSLGKGGLVIKSVVLNGKSYKQFDSSACVVKVPAKTGGEFKVTFATAK